ncbi:MAG: sulfite exporter TauE/SafE family protein [Gammaproteobacteria bacterium]|nr:sulfite exporter TauE/SafE family protein [Gammaproteobacteria bacterium]
MELFIQYLVLGAFAGTLAGLLGVGGGLVIVPVLVTILNQQQVTPDIVVHIAIGSSLATIVATSLSSIYAHHKRGAVLWPVFWQLTPGIVIGALIGALLADAMPADILRKVFALFEFAVAAQLLFGRLPSAHRVLPSTLVLSGVGAIIGAVSSVVGIGGGTMTVPFLIWCNTVAQKAVATSAACGLPIAIAGAIGFAFTGWHTPGLPQWSTGYLYWPAIISIVLASSLFAPVGAHIAHKLPAAKLKKMFGLFLVMLGLKMLLY